MPVNQCIVYAIGILGPGMRLPRMRMIRELRWMMRGTDAQGILGIRKSDPALCRIGKGIAIELEKRLSGKLYIFKLESLETARTNLDKTHGSVGLVFETKPLVSSTLSKHDSQFLFRRIHGQITHVKRVAGRILIATGNPQAR